MTNSSDATRRSRNRSSGRNITCCSVDGCAADLSKCREYHKRHKVCEIHSKSPVVMVGGREQRFCQQCSRFHTLSEFDEGKRSCRKRLDGHNRRRRKLHLNTGSSQTDHQVPRFALHPPSRSASRMLDTNWVNFSESDHRSLDSHCLPLQSPFLQQSKVAMDSDCAFSLLSSSSQSPNINNVVPMMYAADKIPDSMPFSLNDSLGMYPCFQSSCMPMEDGSVGRGLILEANGTKLHCQDAFQGSSKVSFEGACETSSIHWQW